MLGDPPKSGGSENGRFQDTVGLRGRVVMPADDLLKRLEGAGAGLVIADPPWDLQGAGMFDKAASYERQSVETIADTLALAQGVLKPGAHLYLWAPASCALVDVFREFEDRGWVFQRQLAWRKDRVGLGAFQNAFEPILIWSNGPTRGYPGPRGTLKSIFTGVPPRGRTAKPWEPYRAAVVMSTEPGELVVDPYCGTNPLQRAMARTDPPRPWVAGDRLSATEVEDDRRSRTHREAGAIGWGNHTKEVRGPAGQQRLGDLA